jgi:probable rRNA maturation factor
VTEYQKERVNPPGQDGSSRSSFAVEISNTQGFLRVDRGELAGLVERVLRAEDIERAVISVALVDNATIHRLNREYLQHDWPTDVISFLLSEPNDPVLTGELVISAEMASATAAEIEADPWAELVLYTVHGLLHLCSYDDACQADSELMRAREDEVLASEGLVNTYRLAGRNRPAAEQPERAGWSA